MKMIYVINTRMSGACGNVIHFIDSAYMNEEEALEQIRMMDLTYEDDPNYESYITGPILLHEQ